MSKAINDPTIPVVEPQGSDRVPLGRLGGETPTVTTIDLIMSFVLAEVQTALTTGMAGGLRSFQNSAQLSALNVSDAGKFPFGSTATIFNTTTMLLEHWVLLSGAPSGSQLAATGRPAAHWQRG